MSSSQTPSSYSLTTVFSRPQSRDVLLMKKIRAQVEYYFSKENLIRDVYLRKLMDDQGWVPVGLIANFNRVSLLTGDVCTVYDALVDSDVVEVSEGEVRRKGDWSRWLIPPQLRDSIF